MSRTSEGPKTILVVDDDVLILEALRRQLHLAGYFMEAAESGEKALEYAAWSAPDLVILDLKMPGLDGFETCKRMRAMKGWENVPVLILTGDKEDTDYEKAITSGADDFLKKPVIFQELALRIHSLIRIRRLLGDLRDSVTTIKTQQDVILRDKQMREKLQAFLLHDLKNPISSIILQAEMKLHALQDDPERAVEWGQVLNQSERLMMLVTGWMDVLRSEDVGFHLRLIKVNTRTFLEELLHRHTLWFQVRHLKALVKVPEELSEFTLDPTIMERVLGNLLENCIRYSPDGGDILIEVRKMDDLRMRLEVSDHGPGVPEHLQQSIFDMYLQLEAATSQASMRESRGLGLAFCRMAAEAHGGKIWAEDNLAGGTRFVIEMPLRT